MSFNRAVIDYAARNRELLLYDIYRMGRRSIERGSQDTWTPSPSRINASAERMSGPASAERDAAVWAELHKPELRDPRGYIIPSDQQDFPTAVKFINALREVNVAVHRATQPFDVGGKRYPAGSFVVFTAQAFRPHVMDMFEPQDHPNVIPYPGAPPTPPYDNAGWTLAFQMGVQFDRILEPFNGPFENVTDWNVKPPAGRVGVMPKAIGYALSRDTNDAFKAVNRLLASGEQVRRLGTTFLFSPRAATVARLEKVAADLGVNFQGVNGPAGAITPSIGVPRVGLWDQYGGSIESGWTRWILEQFEFPFTRVYAPELDSGSLNAKYDVLIFVQGAIPSTSSGQAPGGRGGRGGGAGPNPEEVPAEYRSQIGRVTAERTIPQIKAFIEAGGTVIAIGDSAMNLANHLALPVENHLVENGVALPRSKYFVPGSVLDRQGRYAPSACRRDARAHRRLLRQQPRVHVAPGRGRCRPALDHDVRQSHSPAQRVGVGAAVPERRRPRARRDDRQRARRPVRPGDPATSPTSRHVQVAVQRHLSLTNRQRR